VPFKFTGKIEKLTIAVDRPTLTPADEKRLMQANQSAADAQ
jgi:arylsulfatase